MILAPFLHFSTLRANRKSEIGNHWVISDFRLLHYRFTPALGRWNSPLVQAVLPVRVCTSSCICMHCLLFYWLLLLKAGLLFIYLSIYLSIYLLIYLFVSLFGCLFLYFFLSFCRATFTYYVYIACCFMGYWFEDLSFIYLFLFFIDNTIDIHIYSWRPW